MNQFQRCGRALGCLSLIAFLLVGCETRPLKQRRVVSSKDILARVGEHVITKKDLQHALSKMSPYMRNQYTSFARRKQLLVQLVEFEVLVLEARRQKLHETHEVGTIRKRAMARLLVNRIVQKVRPVSISREAIQAYYNKHKLKKPFSKVQESIRRVLLKQERNKVYQAFVEKLRQKYKVTVNQKLLSTIPKIRKAATTPGAAQAGRAKAKPRAIGLPRKPAASATKAKKSKAVKAPNAVKAPTSVPAAPPVIRPAAAKPK